MDELKQEMEFISQDENKVSSFITDGGLYRNVKALPGSGVFSNTAEVSKVNVDHHPSQSNKEKIYRLYVQNALRFQFPAYAE